MQMRDRKVGWVKRTIGWLVTIGVLYLYINTIEILIKFLSIEPTGLLAMTIITITGFIGWLFLLVMSSNFDLFGDRRL